jgi:tetratricopeptide (TPR) repeat protein
MRLSTITARRSRSIRPLRWRSPTAREYNIKQDYDLALADCAIVLEQNPRYTRTYFTKAFAQQKKGLFEDAVETLRALIAVTKNQDEIKRARNLIRTLGGTY